MKSWIPHVSLPHSSIRNFFPYSGDEHKSHYNPSANKAFIWLRENLKWSYTRIYGVQYIWKQEKSMELI